MPTLKVRGGINMYNHNSYYDWKGKSDSKVKINLFAIHFKRLAGYNDSWNLNKILLYEYMLISARKYGKKGDTFTQKYSMIAEATQMSKGSVSKYLKQLEDDGFISLKREKRKGVSQLNWYKINYGQIKKSLHQIYDFSGLDKEEVEVYKKDLCKWYDYHSASSYRDANNDGEAPSITA